MKHTAVIASLSFFSLFIILQNTSCMHGNKYLKETKMLDSIQIFVNEADSAVKTIDSAKITGYAKQVEKDNQLLTLAHVDSMSPGAISIFQGLNKARWSLLTVAGKRGPLLTELEKSQKQLKHLSHDLQHNLIKADSVEFYVAYETKKASELVEASNISMNDVKTQIPLYNTLAPKADSLISLLKNHKKF